MSFDAFQLCKYGRMSSWTFDTLFLFALACPWRARNPIFATACLYGAIDHPSLLHTPFCTSRRWRRVPKSPRCLCNCMPLVAHCRTYSYSFGSIALSTLSISSPTSNSVFSTAASSACDLNIPHLLLLQAQGSSYDFSSSSFMRL